MSDGLREAIAEHDAALARAYDGDERLVFEVYGKSLIDDWIEVQSKPIRASCLTEITNTAFGPPLVDVAAVMRSLEGTYAPISTYDIELAEMMNKIQDQMLEAITRQIDLLKKWEPHNGS